MEAGIEMGSCPPQSVLPVSGEVTNIHVWAVPALAPLLWYLLGSTPTQRHTATTADGDAVEDREIHNFSSN